MDSTHHCRQDQHREHVCRQVWMVSVADTHIQAPDETCCRGRRGGTGLPHSSRALVGRPVWATPIAQGQQAAAEDVLA